MIHNLPSARPLPERRQEPPERRGRDQDREINFSRGIDPTIGDILELFFGGSGGSEIF